MEIPERRAFDLKKVLITTAWWLVPIGAAGWLYFQWLSGEISNARFADRTITAASVILYSALYRWQTRKQSNS